MSTYIKKLVLVGIIGISSISLVINDYKSYNKKDTEFRKFMNDVRKLENESYMTRELADMIIEEAS